MSPEPSAPDAYGVAADTPNEFETALTRRARSAMCSDGDCPDWEMPHPVHESGSTSQDVDTDGHQTCRHGSLDPTGRGCSSCVIEHLRKNLGTVLYAVSRSGQPRRFRWNSGRLEAEGIYESDPEWVVLIDGVAQYHERRMDTRSTDAT